MGIVAQLLEHTGLRLAEIAARVGYRSEFAFSRGFARARGLSPARFRNRGNSTRRPNLLCVSKTSSVLIAWQNHITSARMVALISFLLNVVASPFKSKIRLEAENAALRHQLIVLQRKVRGRVPFANSDRLFFVQLYRWFPSVLKALTIIRPETLVRWHRAGFRGYWRRKSRLFVKGTRPRTLRCSTIS